MKAIEASRASSITVAIAACRFTALKRSILRQPLCQRCDDLIRTTNTSHTIQQTGDLSDFSCGCKIATLTQTSA